MSFADYAVIVFYLLLMIAVGFIFQKFSSNLSDYIRTGCKGTWWLVGASLFMQGFSALTFTGICGQAYLAGWSVMIIFWSNALVFFIHAFVVAPYLRQTRAITPPDAIRARFNAYTEQIFVYGGMVGSMLWGGVMLLGLATFSSVVFGLPLEGVILFVGFAVIFYSVIGGSWSVISTDYLQMLILIPVTIAVTLLCLNSFGGIGNILAEIKAQGLTHDFAIIKPAGYEYSDGVVIKGGLFTWPWFWAMIVSSFFTAFNLTLCHRYLAVKTGKEARKAAGLAGVLMILGSFVWFVPPIVGRLFFADQINAIEGIANVADAAYAVVAMEVLPAGMLGLVLIAMFSATMSTMDSSLTGTAGIIANNIYPALCRKFGWKQMEGAALLKFGKLTNLCLGIWAVLLALILSQFGKGGLYNTMLNIAILVGGPLSGPFAYALLIRRVPAWAAVFSMGTGLIASVTIFYQTSFAGVEISWATKIYTMLLATGIPFLLTRLFSKSSSPEFYEHVDAFFKKITTPIDFEKEVGEGNDLTQLKFLGRIGLVTGLAISLLMFAGENQTEYLAVGGISLFIITIAGSMLFIGSRAEKRAATATTKSEK